MLIIGLTGGIACGKSTVSAMLKKLGACIIDADQISRSQTAPGGIALPPIRAAFGDQVFHEDGTLNRPALAKAVFGHPEAMEVLNQITHPLVNQQMRQEMEDCRKMGAQAVVLDVPLLFESHMEDWADFNVCVTVPQEVQIARMASRDGFDREAAMKRIESQMPVSQKAERSDVVIDTNKPLSDLEQEVRKLYEGWLCAARKEQA